MKSRRHPARAVAAIALALPVAAVVFAGDEAREESLGPEATPKEVYMAACAACHGSDGTGAPRRQVGFDTPLPDFTDCSFATREPNADWVAVAHQGGPVRAFSRLMPAFGEALSEARLERAVQHIRTFCKDEAWPRGEFNLPRAQVTTKAFPEDELVVEVAVPTDAERDAVMTKLVYEKRFGARNQFELAVPFDWREDAGGDWRSGVGDIAVGVKRVLYDDLARGSILSGSLEVSLPTGDADDGFGSDTALFEPSLLYGQILPRGAFFQGQLGFGVPVQGDKANEEVFLRLAAGRSFFPGSRFGRPVTPMLEVVGSRELNVGARTHWDAVPQVQVMLSQRQHVRLNLGVRAPIDDNSHRDTQFVMYLLWDWFDGGLTEGW